MEEMRRSRTYLCVTRVLKYHHRAINARPNLKEAKIEFHQASLVVHFMLIN
jgi:hypothetical protein